MIETHRKIKGGWDRLEKIITRSGMTTNAFARHIGLPRGENLYQIKRGNNGISQDVARRICDKFPNVNKLWLLTGEGKAFADANTPSDLIPPPAIEPRMSEQQRFFTAATILPALIAKGVANPATAAVKYADELLAELQNPPMICEACK